MPALGATVALQSTVCAALDALIEAARPHDGLFPSVLDCASEQMPWSLPASIEGQRDEDRSFPGSNLAHDHSTLRTMLDVAAVTGKTHYADAARVYLHRFATHCANTGSGLFPWGEHSFWNLIEDRPGNSYPLFRTRGRVTHDHLLQAPLWLWEELWRIRPECVTRFAEGLDNHWVGEQGSEYQRHAEVLWRKRNDAPGKRSCDFPRHSGFYILDLAFAHARSGRDEFLAQARKMSDYWWQRREPQDSLWPGLLAIESRSPAGDANFHGILSAIQTLSLGVSLLEASQPLGRISAASGFAAELRTRGLAHISAFFDAHDRLPAGTLADSMRRGQRQWVRPLTTWGSRYGAPPAAVAGLLACQAFALGGDHRALVFAAQVARGYVDSPIPSGAPVVAKDAGVALLLLGEIYRNSGQQVWLDSALELAEAAVSQYFQPGARLPRGATGIGYYESQMLPGYLLAGLARLAFITGGVKSLYPVDVSLR